MSNIINTMKTIIYNLYLITNKINNKKYIGQTKQNLKNRFNGHKTKAKNGSNLILHNAIRKYGVENFEIILLETTDNLETCNFRETNLIKEYNTLIPNGYNMIEGGCNTISKKGFKISDKHKNNIKRSHLKNCKPIIQFNIKNGEIIKEWYSGRELLRNNYSRANICKICKSSKKYGYMYNSGWCYKDFYDSLIDKNLLININYNSHGITIKCLDLNNNLVKIYNKIRTAAKELNCSPSSIQDCLKGRAKTCKGYKWEYSN